MSRNWSLYWCAAPDDSLCPYAILARVLTLLSNLTRRSFLFLSTPAMRTRRKGAVCCFCSGGGAGRAGTGSPYTRGSRRSGTVLALEVEAAELWPQGPAVDSVALGSGEGTADAAELPPHALVESRGSMLVAGGRVCGDEEAEEAEASAAEESTVEVMTMTLRCALPRFWFHLGGGGATGGQPLPGHDQREASNQLFDACLLLISRRAVGGKRTACIRCSASTCAQRNAPHTTHRSPHTSLHRTAAPSPMSNPTCIPSKITLLVL